MLENIEIFINFSNYNIKDLFSLLSNNKSLEKLDFLPTILEKINLFGDFNNICEVVFEDKRSIKCFTFEEIELLKGFFSCLGQTDKSGQISNCKMYKELLKKRLDILETQEKSKYKSQMAFSIGLGIMFSIMIL